MLTSRQLRFGRFRLVGPHGPLHHGDTVIALPPKALLVLWTLAGRAGEVVTKNELLAAVWPGTVVTEGVIAACLRDLRRALGDDFRQPRFIATAHRIGYRFIASVASVASVASPAQEPDGSEAAAPFVGRSDELGQLHACFARALAGQRQLVFVSGEAGIGKSRLVETFVAALERGRSAAGEPGAPGWLSGLRLAHGQCIEHHGAGEPYLPLLEALARLCRQAGADDLPAQLRRFAPTALLQLPGLLDDADHLALQLKVAGSNAARMLRELVEAIEIAAAQQPLVLVLEDMHWSDRATVDWLSMLSRRRENTRLLVIATCRQVELIVSQHPLKAVKHELVARGVARELQLGPLPADAVREYAEQRLASTDAAMVGAVVQRSLGHPLHMVHLADHLKAQWQGQTARGPDQALAIDAAMPQGLRELIEAQLARLDATQQAALSAASVAGQEFAAASVAAALRLETDVAEQILETLSGQQQFIEARGLAEWRDGSFSGRYAFRHALHRDLLYSRVGAARRAAWHARIGERLVRAQGAFAADLVPELALHFDRARQPRRAATHYREAAEMALRRFDCATALAHVEQGLALLQQADAGDPERAHQHGPEHERTELLLRLTQGSALLATAGFAAPSVEQTYLRARALSQRLGDDAARGPVLSGLWNVYLTRAAFDAAWPVAEECLALAQRQPDAVTTMLAHNMRAQGLLFAGEPTQALQHIEHSQALYDPRAHRGLTVVYGEDPGIVCHHCAALTRWVLGQPRLALQHLQRGTDIAHALDHPFGEAQMLWMEAVMSFDAGADERLDRSTRQLLPLCEANGFALWLAGARMLRGAALAAQGQTEAGVKQAERGLSEWRQSGTLLMLPHSLAVVATVLAAHGRCVDAQALLQEALGAVALSGERWYEAELQRLSATLALRLAGPSPRARQRAQRGYLRALAIARRQGARTFELRAALALADHWREQGDMARARRVLAPVYAAFTDGQPTGDLRAAQALLDSLVDA